MKNRLLPSTLALALAISIPATVLLAQSAQQQEGLMLAVHGLAAIAPAVVTLFNTNSNTNSNSNSGGNASGTGMILHIVLLLQFLVYTESA